MGNPSRYQNDPMEGMIDMMVEQAKMADDLYEQYQIEEDEFNSAVMFYDLGSDPELNKLMQENMRKLGLGGPGGAMGGFGGMGGF